MYCPDDAKELPDFSYITDFRLSDMVITDSEVLAQLTSLKCSKATCPDSRGHSVRFWAPVGFAC